MLGGSIEGDGEMSDDQTLRIAARAVQLYAETHPRPTQVTQAQVAEILGVSTRTVRNYIVAGKLRLNRCGRVPIEAVDALRAPQ
jgi:DNA-binding transcriptional regulator LsrR (DeoR family)